MSPQRIFFIGGTGNVGSKTVKFLLEKQIPVTLYARSQAKVDELFGGNELVSVVQGDYSDLSPLEKGLEGHTRLFLLCVGGNAEIKKAVGKYAFAAGVKQIVDISSSSAGYAWRTTHIGYEHQRAEQALVEELARPKDAHVVTLRPSRFMSNTLLYDLPHNDLVTDVCTGDKKQQWISPNDIAELAAIVLTDDIAKHQDAVYEMVGDTISPGERAEFFTDLLGRKFTYKQLTPTERFAIYSKVLLSFLPYKAVLDLATHSETEAGVTPYLEILLGRPPETYKEFITTNKAALQLN